MSVSSRTRVLPQGTDRAVPLKIAGRGVKDLIRSNSLSIVLFGLFALFLGGQSVAGWLEHNETARQHGEQVLGYLPYLVTGHLWQAVFENWESEFLQMAAFVLLTSFLYQKGSAESKKLPEEGENPQDEDPKKHQGDPDAPGPVKRGGWMMWLYERSLCSVLTLFFLLSFAGHALAGAREFNQERQAHNEATVSVFQYLGSSKFWFESLQNWQSEFLAVFALVVLSIYLRGQGSAESKPVAAPHSQTGSE